MSAKPILMNTEKDLMQEPGAFYMQDVITFGYSGSADFEDFGKTVFLTRAEAEAALRREQEAT